MWFLTHAWIIPALPALGFVLILLFGKRILGPTRAHWLGIPLVAIAFVLSICTGVAWIVHSNQPVPTEAASLRYVEPSCSHEAALAHIEHASAESGTATSTENESESGGEQFSAPVVRCVAWFDSGPAKVTIGTMVDGQAA